MSLQPSPEDEEKSGQEIAEAEPAQPLRQDDRGGSDGLRVSAGGGPGMHRRGKVGAVGHGSNRACGRRGNKHWSGRVRTGGRRSFDRRLDGSRDPESIVGVAAGGIVAIACGRARESRLSQPRASSQNPPGLIARRGGSARGRSRVPRHRVHASRGTTRRRCPPCRRAPTHSAPSGPPASCRLPRCR